MWHWYILYGARIVKMVACMGGGPTFEDEH